MNKLDIFWQNFLKDTNRDQNSKYVSSFHFELNEY